MNSSFRRDVSFITDQKLKRFGTPADVAYAALYLASDASNFVTGIEMNIDGGLLAGAAAPPQKAGEG